MGRLLFVVGAALGYVLGARAGRRRYEQIKAGAEKLWNDPNVQKSVDQVQGFVKDKAPEVQSAVKDGAKKAAAKVQHKDDPTAAASGADVTTTTATSTTSSSIG